MFLFPDIWHHLAVTYDYYNGAFVMYMDGDVVYDENITEVCLVFYSYYFLSFISRALLLHVIEYIAVVFSRIDIRL